VKERRKRGQRVSELNAMSCRVGRRSLYTEIWRDRACVTRYVVVWMRKIERGTRVGKEDKTIEKRNKKKRKWQ